MYVLEGYDLLTWLRLFWRQDTARMKILNSMSVRGGRLYW